MKMETPFTGQLAVLGVRGNGGHFLSLRGRWRLAAGAVVYHQPLGLDDGRTPVGTTVIGHITGLDVWQGNLAVSGNGVTWLADMLRAGTHALSMDMRDTVVEGGEQWPVIAAGTVRAALLVKKA